MIPKKVDDVIWKIAGGYTTEREDIDREKSYDNYELTSIVPNKERLDELLRFADILQRTK